MFNVKVYFRISHQIVELRRCGQCICDLQDAGLYDNQSLIEVVVHDKNLPYTARIDYIKHAPLDEIYNR